MPGGHDDGLPRSQPELAVVGEVDDQGSFEDQKEFVGRRVRVPGILAFDYGEA
jgi:hypothetical protein